MISAVRDTSKRLTRYLALEHRIPTYVERADFYKRLAIIESVKAGILLDPETSVYVEDITARRALALPDSTQIEFARDRNGIFFARIEGGRCYPINSELPEELLRKSDEQERLARSVWRRALVEPYELSRLNSISFLLDKIRFNISDIAFLLYFTVKNSSQLPESQERERILRGLVDIVR